MNPAALATNLGDLVPRRRAHRQQPTPSASATWTWPAARPIPWKTARWTATRSSGRHDPAHPLGRRGTGTGHQGGGPLPEFFRHGPGLLALRPLAGADAAIYSREVRPPARRGRGQPAGLAGRLQLRRNDRGLHGRITSIAPTCPPGRYRNITGNQALAWGAHGRRQAQRLRAVLRQLPHHAGQRHPARAVEAEELRRADLPGRRRDCRRHRGHRGGLRRRDGRDRHQRAGPVAQGRGAWAWRS